MRDVAKRGAKKLKKKKICQWVRLNHGISTLCGKETHLYGEDMKFCPFCGSKLVYKTVPKTLGEIKGSRA